MVVPKDVYRQIASNNRRLLGLILLFPLALSGFVYVFLRLFELIYNASAYSEASNNYTHPVSYQPIQLLTNDNLTLILFIVLLAAVLIILFSFLQGKNLILGLTGSHLCPNDPEHTRVFHAVENVALAAGIPTPQVYLLQSRALNAFATGYSPQNAAITLTTGLIERLSPLELEAVIAHEVGHILNRDIRLNLFIITGIGVIGLMGEVLLRIRGGGRSNRGKGGGIIIILLALGFGFYLFRLLVAPFIHMAISRTQEFQADATSAHLTRHPQALIDALVKISENPTVPVLAETNAFASMCIFSPDTVSHLLDTHPPIEDRIRRLEEMS
ncbi:MAG: M48 family metallopeptidase [Pseudomonadota bacterium]|nr:M48 family metallopeptidase [Pseudomonadota bacterium]